MRLAEEGAVPLKPATRSGYVAGVTIFVGADGKLGLFENGLRQNVLFLYQLLRAAPGCERVYLLNHGDGDLAEDVRGWGVDPEDVVRTPQVADQLDLVVVLGAAMDPAQGRALRDRGCRLYAYKGGNAAVISMEAMIAQPPRGDAERYFDHDLYDAILMTPQHWRTYRGWCETVYRRPVVQVPQIWAPTMIEGAPRDLAARFDYEPGAAAWRVGVMDPNITVMKTSHMPMLACEAAYRIEPEMFRAVFVANGWPHRENPHLVSLAQALSICRAGVMTFEPRFVGIEFLADHCDALVTHQWENALNYLYYEALFGGYPLVHNSPMLGELGWRWADFEPEDGARALRLAKARHDDELAGYRDRARSFLARIAPTSPGSIAAYERAMGLRGG